MHVCAREHIKPGFWILKLIYFLVHKSEHIKLLSCSFFLSSDLRCWRSIRNMLVCFIGLGQLDNWSGRVTFYLFLNNVMLLPVMSWFLHSLWILLPLLALNNHGGYIWSLALQEPRLGRWGRTREARNGVLIHRLELSWDIRQMKWGLYLFNFDLKRNANVEKNENGNMWCG